MRCFRFIALVAVACGLLGCGSDPVAPGLGDLVEVKVNVDDGFEGHYVWIVINGNPHFHAAMDSVASAGLGSSFTTYLIPDTYEFHVSWQPIGSQTEPRQFKFSEALAGSDPVIVSIAFSKGEPVYRLNP